MKPESLYSEIKAAFQIDGTDIETSSFSTVGEGALPSWFRVTDLAATSIGVAGAMLARAIALKTDDPLPVVVDRRLASFWFRRSLHPLGWKLSPIWDSIAGNYKTEDGWIRLHTNARHHRDAALTVLKRSGERDAVANAVERWEAETLETAIVEAGGCAAKLRSLKDWATHPQGSAVASEPLIIWDEHEASAKSPTRNAGTTPLQGLRILDLTRVLAGPIATRFLAGFGADVLRLDPPDWEELAIVPETTLGKRCAGLDLRDHNDRQTFEKLLATADVLVHGYRPGALESLGFDQSTRRVINPGLIDVSLNAYGWSGPWSGRRGFDSLVQMSSGIADFGMKQSADDQPVPLPVQALDHATGYLLAAAVLHGLARRRQGTVFSARLSLARTAHLLAAEPNTALDDGLSSHCDNDLDPNVEQTAWGAARRIRFPMTVGGLTPNWRYPARPLRSSRAAWAEHI
ncbi:MAG: CoA transferase [Geminicoccaceae bacterium]